MVAAMRSSSNKLNRGMKPRFLREDVHRSVGDQCAIVSQRHAARSRFNPLQSRPPAPGWPPGASTTGRDDEPPRD